MAATAYFRKMRENDVNIFYAYGSDIQALTSELIFDKENQQPKELMIWAIPAARRPARLLSCTWRAESGPRRVLA
jgi:hypothetical protein